MSKKEKFLKAIEEMLGGNIDIDHAICENLDDKTEITFLGYKLVEKLSKSWSKFSGDCNYPVGDRNEYTRHFYGGTLWTGEQRELRMSLLEHMKSEILKLTDEEVKEMFK